MARTKKSRPVAVLLGLTATLVVAARGEPRTWDDDGVTISTSASPVKRQDFAIDIPRRSASLACAHDG